MEQQIADCEAAQSACGSDYVKLQELTERQKLLADIDGNDKLTAVDALRILRCAVNGHF